MISPVWTYWEGEKPPAIELCLEAMPIVFGAGRTRIVTPENVDQFLPSGVLHENWRELPSPAIRCAALRVALVSIYGGWWFDGDSIPLRPPAPRINGFAFTSWEPRRPINGYFGANRGNQTTCLWLDLINEALACRTQTKRPIGWGELGERLLSAALVIHPGTHVPRQRWIPCDFNANPHALIRPGKWRDFVTNDSVAFALNYSWLREHAPQVLDLPRDQLADSPLLIHSILNHGKRLIERVHDNLNRQWPARSVPR